jgi:hypothetical protein
VAVLKSRQLRLLEDRELIAQNVAILSYQGILSPALMADAFAEVERWDLHVVNLWVNHDTFREMCRELQNHLHVDWNVRPMTAQLWNAAVLTSEAIPEHTLLLIADRDPEYLPGQSLEGRRLYRY